MIIRHYSYSKSGGAGFVAARLSEFQKKIGYDSQLVTSIDGTLRNEIIKNYKMVALASIDKYLLTKKNNLGLFSNFRNSYDQELNLIKNQISHLHWTPGIISIEQISNVVNQSSKTIWTLHDMWLFTGGCHYSLGCENFKNNCDNCPQIKGPFKSISKSQQQNKVQALSEQLSKITFVSPSRWLQNEALASTVLKNADIRVIRNPIDLSIFYPVREASDYRKFLGIDQYDFVIGCSAMDLDDPIKNIDSIMRVVNKFAENLDFDSRRVVLLCIGSGGNPNFEVSNNLKIIKLGQIPQEVAAKAYRAMDIFVQMSFAENFPNTVIEALSCGIPLICANRGGMTEIVFDSEAGLIVNNELDLYNSISILFRDSLKLQTFSTLARKYVENVFSNSKIQEEYLSLYVEGLR